MKMELYFNDTKFQDSSSYEWLTLISNNFYLSWSIPILDHPVYGICAKLR